MRKLILLFSFTLFIGVCSAQVNGNINGSSLPVLNSKGELIYNNTTAAGIPLQIKSFSIDYTFNKMALSVSTTQGLNTVSKEDMKLIREAKGSKATIKNVMAVDKNGSEVKLPDASFTIQ